MCALYVNLRSEITYILILTEGHTFRRPQKMLWLSATSVTFRSDIRTAAMLVDSGKLKGKRGGAVSIAMLFLQTFMKIRPCFKNYKERQTQKYWLKYVWRQENSWKN
jgi:hypothetical protein